MKGSAQVGTKNLFWTLGSGLKAGMKKAHLGMRILFQYLELRFKSRPVRLIGTTLFILSTVSMHVVAQGPRMTSPMFQLMYMAVVLYAPSVALSAGKLHGR